MAEKKKKSPGAAAYDRAVQKDVRAAEDRAARAIRESRSPAIGWARDIKRYLGLGKRNPKQKDSK